MMTPIHCPVCHEPKTQFIENIKLDGVNYERRKCPHCHNIFGIQDGKWRPSNFPSRTAAVLAAGFSIFQFVQGVKA